MIEDKNNLWKGETRQEEKANRAYMNSQTRKIVSWLRDDLLDFRRRVNECLSSTVNGQGCCERDRDFWRIRTEGWVR